MADKVKHNFYVSVVLNVVLDNVPLKWHIVLKTLLNNPCSFFYSEKMIKSVPIKLLLLVMEGFGNLCKALKWLLLCDE